MLATSCMAYVMLPVEGTQVPFPLGDADLMDPQASPEKLSLELPVYARDMFVNAFEASESAVLRALAGNVAALSVRGDSDQTPSGFAKVFRNFCREDVRALRGYPTLGTLRFGEEQVVRKEATRLMEGDPTPIERLTSLLNLARGVEEGRDPKTFALVRKRILHEVQIHPYRIGTEHIEGLLRLAMEGKTGYPPPILEPLNKWVEEDPARVAKKLLRREHLPLVFELAKRPYTYSYTIFRQLLATLEAAPLFEGNDLYFFFSQMSDPDICYGVLSLVERRPEIFTSDHVAWLEALAPFGEENSYHANFYEKVLYALRKRRPELFAKHSGQGWLGRFGTAKKTPKTRVEAQQIADEIVKRATAPKAA